MAIAHQPPQIDVEQDGQTITIVLRSVSSAQPADELVAIERESLRKLDLEYAPILGACQAGTLKSIWLGRRRYTKRSWLVALADTLPPATDVEQPPADDLTLAFRRRAERLARRAGAR